MAVRCVRRAERTTAVPSPASPRVEAATPRSPRYRRLVCAAAVSRASLRTSAAIGRLPAMLLLLQQVQHPAYLHPGPCSGRPLPLRRCARRAEAGPTRGTRTVAGALARLRRTRRCGRLAHVALGRQQRRRVFPDRQEHLACRLRVAPVPPLALVVGLGRRRCRLLARESARRRALSLVAVGEGKVARAAEHVQHTPVRPRRQRLEHLHGVSFPQLRHGRDAQPLEVAREALRDARDGLQRRRRARLEAPPQRRRRQPLGGAAAPRRPD
mmetsp:Transcript_13815/g.48151  ORF Transcript_13815/g.48151 Transcript_13815/m.48151 type:complete len:269 (+) Transcript_13815:224-1030(+)